jgi:hypothetical protein
MEQNIKENSMTVSKTGTEKISATKIDNILYLRTQKKKVLPAYAYYMLEADDCKGLCFEGSIRIYKKESLKGKQDWKDVK